MDDRNTAIVPCSAMAACIGALQSSPGENVFESWRSCGWRTRGPALGRNKYGLSPLDVDAVDMHRFPRAAEAPTAPRPHAELTPPTFRCMLDH